MRVIDTDDQRLAWAGADQSVDDLCYSSQWVRTEIGGDVGEGAERNAVSGRRPHDPAAPRIARTTCGDGFASQPRLTHAGGS